jgi:hypothetical protein
MRKKNPAAVALGKRRSPAKARAAQINGRKGGNPWRSVKRHLPRQGQQVVAKYVGVYGPRIVTYWHDGANSHFGDRDTLASEPASHWKKL